MFVVFLQSEPSKIVFVLKQLDLFDKIKPVLTQQVCFFKSSLFYQTKFTFPNQVFLPNQVLLTETKIILPQQVYLT